MKHLLDIWPGRSPVQACRVQPSAGRKLWLPPTFAYPWGMVYQMDQEEAEPAAAGVEAEAEAAAAEAAAAAPSTH